MHKGLCSMTKLLLIVKLKINAVFREGFTNHTYTRHRSTDQLLLLLAVCFILYYFYKSPYQSTIQIWYNLNLWDLTSKIVLIYTRSHVMCGEARRHMHTLVSSNSLLLAVKTKTKKDFHISAMLLILILQNSNQRTFPQLPKTSYSTLPEDCNHTVTVGCPTSHFWP